jgi:pyridoxine kinase
MPRPSILSVQSHVAYGYVGNRAAVFPLQRMGFDVTAVNTVQFSNHTGYGSFAGEVFPAAHVAAVIDGIAANGGLAETGAVLTGYLGTAELGEVVLERVARLRAGKPGLLHVCDPVMGDVGRGFFVKPGVPEFFRDKAVPSAGVLTPNQFELEVLTGRRVATLADAAAACDDLHARGVGTVLVTSLAHDRLPDGRVAMLVSDRATGRHLAETERVPLAHPANGSGDCTAALFCGALLSGHAAPEALARTTAAILAVFRATAAKGTRELALIEAQAAFELRDRVPVAGV